MTPYIKRRFHFDLTWTVWSIGISFGRDEWGVWGGGFGLGPLTVLVTRQPS